MEMRIVLLISVLLLSIVRVSRSCSGYVFDLIGVSSCDDHSVLTLASRSTFHVGGEDCSGIGNICYSVQQEVSSAYGSATLYSKAFMWMPVSTRSINLCSLLLNRNSSSTDGCILQQGTSCKSITRTFKMGIGRHLLPFLSKEYRIKFQIDHGKDKSSCFMITMKKSDSQ